jgi:hypothetical protein
LNRQITSYEAVCNRFRDRELRVGPAGLEPATNEL